jgi:hypothetical protein
MNDKKKKNFASYVQSKEHTIAAIPTQQGR